MQKPGIQCIYLNDRFRSRSIIRMPSAISNSFQRKLFLLVEQLILYKSSYDRKHSTFVKHSIIEIAFETKHIRSLYSESGIEIESLTQKRPFNTEIEVTEAILFLERLLPPLQRRPFTQRLAQKPMRFYGSSLFYTEMEMTDYCSTS